MIYYCQLAVCVSTPIESIIPEWELSPGVLVSSRNTLLAFGVIYVVDGRAYFGKCPKLSWSPGVELERDKRDYWDDDLWSSIGSLCVHPYRIYDPGTSTIPGSSGIFQKQSNGIPWIGSSWGERGLTFQMWFRLHACSAFREWLFSWDGTWKGSERLFGWWFMIVNWPSVCPPL